jgi:hypothetical protein
MRILFVCEERIREEHYRNVLASIAERDSIYFLYSYDHAVEFLKDKLIKNQEQMDLVLIKQNKYSKLENDFRRFLISDSMVTYSNRNFNLKCLPVFTLLDRSYDLSEFGRKGYFRAFYDHGSENLHQYRNEIFETIKDWRRSVLDELGDLGIKFNSGQIDYTHIFSKDFKTNHNTHILSESFKLFPRKLNYCWLNENARQIEIAIDEFAKLLKNENVKNKKQEEKKYHRFFNNHRYFLERDRYSKTWYESKFKINNTEHYDPDFTLKTNLNYTTDLSVVEVKLPNEGFLKQSSFHKNFYAKIFDHIAQVNDYKDYLESRINTSAINEQLGFVPKRVEYNILIGREKDKEENAHQFKKRMDQFNVNDINFMTYDELLSYQVEYMERMRLLEIR